ncbi:MAG: FAD-dependent oxidoreductase [Clostridia bacterium]|nr:FAD-dependent oxidoreductase [Clostridia bacterium]
MKQIFDCLIVGAGVVGASIFNKLTLVGKKCLLIDKASDVATGASKANSGLVHAGYDPVPGSLKAEMNVRGNKLMPKICKRLGVPLKKCGALVVGDDKERVENLYSRGLENGVSVEVWDRTKIEEKIPDINKQISVALYARDSYIVSPYLLTICLTEEGILNGGQVSLEEDVESITKSGDLFAVKTQKGTYLAKNIINSAGAGYNEIAKLIGAEQYPLELRRGEYFVFDKSYKLNVPCTIFPLPTKLGKGVLITPTVDGNFLVGPTSEENDGKTDTTAVGLASIKEKSKNILDTIDFRQAIRQFAGVRVISGDDFIIEKSKKVEGVINLAGICSPGLSSAPAIAEKVLKLLKIPNKEFKDRKQITPYVMFKDMSKAEQKKRLAEDKNYGEIVCKCEKITKGDLLFVLNRPLKISSVDGIKRRTNAGMGRCQSGFCFTKVIQAISDTRKIPYASVKKENRGSEVAVGTMREVNHD